jgi:hypothetical protein
MREEIEEELLPEAFNADVNEISLCLQDLEQCRIKILDWLYKTDAP